MYFDLFVTNVEKEGPFLKIWGQKDHAGATNVERSILEYFDKFEQGEGLASPSQLHIDLLCCARYTDGSYYRARILELDVVNGLATCLFIDYGNKDRVSTSDIRIPSSSQVLFRIPAQASSFILSGIVGTWDPNVLRVILEKISYEDVKGLVIKTTGPRNEISLLKLYHEGRDFIEVLLNSGIGSQVPPEGFEVMIWNLLSASNPGQMTTPANHSAYPNFHMMNMMNQWQQMMFAGMHGMMPPPGSSLPSGPSPMLTSPALAAPVDMRKKIAKNVTEPLTRFSTINLENNSEHKVFISHIEKGTVSFAAQLLSFDKELKDMMAALNSPSVSFTNLKPPYVPGIICLAKCSEDNTFCRAVITGTDNERVLVYFVDYGNSEAVKIKNIFNIPPEYIHPKMMAVQFTLAGLQDVNCTDEIKQVFSDIALEKEAVLRVIPPKCEDLCTKQLAELYLDDSNVKELINVELLKKRPRSSKLQLRNVQMPDSGCTVKVVVAYVKSAANFFVQLASQQDDLESTMAQVAEYCQGPARKMTVSDIQPGAVCCALFPLDDQWYRALIINSDINDLTVMYVDYGNEEKVGIEDLRMASPEILALRAQAIPCSLSGFEQRGDDEALSSRFEEIVLENTFTMKVVQLKKEIPCLVVRLLNDKGIDIARLVDSSPVNGHASEDSYSTPSSASIPEKIDQRDNGKIHRSREDIVSGKAGERPGSSSDHGFSRGRSVENGFEENLPRSSGGRSKERHDQVGDYDCPKKNPEAWGIGKHDRFSSNFGHRDRDSGKDYDQPENRSGQSKFGSSGTGHDKSNDRSGQSKFGSSGTGHDKSNDRSGQSKFGSSGAGYDKSNDRSGQSKFSSSGTGHDKSDRSGTWDDSPARPLTLKQVSVDVGLRKPVSLVFSDGPSDFYLQERTSSDDLDTIMAQISERYSEGGEHFSTSEIAVGTACVAKYSEDDTWYRAVIKSVTSGGVEVFFSDYGNSETVDTRDLKKIDSSIVSLKGQAIHCELMGVLDTSISDDKREEFISLADCETLEAEFVHLKGDIYSVILRDTTRTGTINESFGASAASMLSPTSIVNSVKPQKLNIGDVHNVVVTWFVNPGRFYVTLKSSEDEFKAMMLQLNKEYSQKHPLPLVSPAIGQIVVARYKEDNALYRGQVKVQKADKYGIQYVDYGNRSLVEPTSIYGLEHQYATMSSQAILCTLQGVKPVQGEWTKADPHIRECFQGSNLSCTIVSESSTSEGEMCYIVNMSKDGQDLAQELITKQLAQMDKVQCAEKSALLPEMPVDPQLLVDQTLKVFVDAVEENNFFILESDCLKIREELSRVLNLLDFVHLPPGKVRSGQQCVVLSQHHQEYRRAIIADGKSTGGVTVQYMDFGASEEVSCEVVFMLPQSVSGPALVMECSVTSVTENDTRSVVGQHVIVAFRSCSGGRLFAKLLNDEDAAAMSPLPMPIIRRKIEVSVSHASGVSIWIQQTRQADLLSQLLEEMFEMHEEIESPASLVVGTVCAAKSVDDDNWYRAELLEVLEDSVTVRYTDYGNSEIVPKQNLKMLCKKFLDIPMLAAKMTLPIITDDTSFGETILQMADDKIFTAVVVKENQEWFVELLNGKQEFSVELIRTGRALSMKDSPFPAILAEASSESSLTIDTPTSAVVSYAISTSEFYIQEEKDISSLDELQADLQTLSHCMMPLENLKVGSMCMALYDEDCTWYRGMVTADKKIFFVDYGNSENVQTQNIKVLPPAMEQRKFYAVKCCLKAPEGKQWSGNATERLTELIVDPEESVIVTAISTQEDFKVVDILTSSGNVADILEAEGLLEDVKSKLKVNVTSVTSPSDFWVSCPDLPTSNANKTLHCALYLPSDICEWSQASISHFKKLAADGNALFDLEILIPGDVRTVGLTLFGKNVDEELVALCHQVTPTNIQEMAESLENAENFPACDDTGTVSAALLPNDELSKGSTIQDNECTVTQSGIVEEQVSQAVVAGSPLYVEADSSNIADTLEHGNVGVDENSSEPDTTSSNVEDTFVKDERTVDNELLVNTLATQEIGQFGNKEDNSAQTEGEVSNDLENSVVEVSCSTVEIPVITIDDSADEDVGACREILEETLSENTSQVLEACGDMSVGAGDPELDVSEISDLSDTQVVADDVLLIQGSESNFTESALKVGGENITSETSLVATEALYSEVLLEKFSYENDESTRIDIEQEHSLSLKAEADSLEHFQVPVEELNNEELRSTASSIEEESFISKDLQITELEENVVVDMTMYADAISCELDVGGVFKEQFLAKALDFQSEFQLCIPGSVVYMFEDCEHHACSIDVSSSIVDAAISCEVTTD